MVTVVVTVHPHLVPQPPPMKLAKISGRVFEAAF